MTFPFKKAQSVAETHMQAMEDELAGLQYDKKSEGAIVNGLRSVSNMLMGMEDAAHKEDLEDIKGKMVGIVKTSGQLIGQLKNVDEDSHLDVFRPILVDVLDDVGPLLKKAN